MQACPFSRQPSSGPPSGRPRRVHLILLGRRWRASRSVTHAHFLWSIPRVPFASRWDARSVPYMKRVITPSPVIRAENVGNPAADDGVRSGSRIRATRRGVRGYYRLHLNPWARQNFWHAMCWTIRGFFIGKSCSPRTMRAGVDSIRWSVSRLAGFSLTRRPALTNGSGTMRGDIPRCDACGATFRRCTRA